MALYGDLSYDSRVQKEARTLAGVGYRVVIACLATADVPIDLPSAVTVVVVRPPLGPVLPGATNPFVAAEPSRIASVRRRLEGLVSYVRGLRGWGRMAVQSVGEVDAWHAHDLTGLAAISRNVPPSVPIVYDSHELFLEYGTALRLPAPVRRALRRYERRLVSRTSAVITVNQEIGDVLSRRYRPARIALVHNCPVPWAAPARRPSLIRDATGIPMDAPIVLYHGGLIEGRGIEALMDALQQGGLEQVHLVLMGYGDRRDHFMRIASAPLWGQRMHVLDPVPPADLLPWVASADLGAMPNPGRTQNDVYSSPNKLFECLAAGTPVVASDFPTMRRILIDNPEGPLGAVCDPSNAGSIASAIQSILRLDAPDREALRMRCFMAAARRWNWDHEAESLLSVYAALLPGRSAPAGSVTSGSGT
jgi:glycosyltransferase involved in cell wall biosynthesis